VTQQPDELRAAMREDLTAAIKARESDHVSALRTAIAAIDNAEAVEATQVSETATSEHFAGAHVGLGVTEADRRHLGINEIRDILRAQITERDAEADRYEVLGKADAAARLRREAAALRQYAED
jgi:uncharacterized protein YqeY